MKGFGNAKCRAPNFKENMSLMASLMLSGRR